MHPKTPKRVFEKNAIKKKLFWKKKKEKEVIFSRNGISFGNVENKIGSISNLNVSWEIGKKPKKIQYIPNWSLLK